MFKVIFCVEANAATFNSFFDIITPENDSVAIEVINDSEKFAHVFSVTVFEIDNPVDRNPIKSSAENIITFTPARQLVGIGAKAKTKFIYNGPKDDKERYFSIKWNDSVLRKVPSKGDINESSSGIAYLNNSIITTLIVNPRDGHVDLKYHDKNITNNGNMTVDMFVNGVCKENGSSSGCSIVTPIRPGQKVSVEKLNLNEEFSAGYWISRDKAISVDLSS